MKEGDNIENTFDDYVQSINKINDDDTESKLIMVETSSSTDNYVDVIDALYTKDYIHVRTDDKVNNKFENHVLELTEQLGTKLALIEKDISDNTEDVNQSKKVQRKIDDDDVTITPRGKQSQLSKLPLILGNANTDKEDPSIDDMIKGYYEFLDELYLNKNTNSLSKKITSMSNKSPLYKHILRKRVIEKSLSEDQELIADYIIHTTNLFDRFGSALPYFPDNEIVSQIQIDSTYNFISGEAYISLPSGGSGGLLEIDDDMVISSNYSLLSSDVDLKLPPPTEEYTLTIDDDITVTSTYGVVSSDIYAGIAGSNINEYIQIII